jgi:hypothetical protein
MTIHSTDPRDPKRDILRPREAAVSTGTTVAIAAALVVILGIVWYAMSDNRPTASTTVPPMTTGQTAPAPAPVPAPEAK